MDIEKVSSKVFQNEKDLITSILHIIISDEAQKHKIIRKTKELINKILHNKSYSIEHFYRRYTLEFAESRKLLLLLEALERMEDYTSSLGLFIECMAEGNWLQFVGIHGPLYVNVTSIGLYILSLFMKLNRSKHLVGKILYRALEPLVFSMFVLAVKPIAKSFLFTEDICLGMAKAKSYPGYRFVFVLMGYPALTSKQAKKTFTRYLDIVDYIVLGSNNMRNKHSISIKLSTIYPRFEYLQIPYIKEELLPQLIFLISYASQRGVEIMFDAEEVWLFNTQLEVMTLLIKEANLRQCSNFGITISANNKMSLSGIEYLVSLARKHEKKISIKLVKGLYWDSEMKYVKDLRLENYPIFIRKEFTEANYIACAKLMFLNSDILNIYFGTHNPSTVSAIIAMSGNFREFEFQKMYGMGDALFAELKRDFNVGIVAPIGEANTFLLREMIYNKSNISFLTNIYAGKQDIIDNSVYEEVMNGLEEVEDKLVQLYSRDTSIGYDMNFKITHDQTKELMGQFLDKVYKVGCIINGQEVISHRRAKEVFRPGNFAEKVGEATFSVSDVEIKQIFALIKDRGKWPNTDKIKMLRKIATSLEQNRHELYALLLKECGFNIKEAIYEVSLAIDICHHYASIIKELLRDVDLAYGDGMSIYNLGKVGVIVCINSWISPVFSAIASITAALAGGNVVIFKASENAAIISNFLIKTIYAAGVPAEMIHLLLISEEAVEKYLLSEREIEAVTFCGTWKSGKAVQLALASNDNRIIPLFANIYTSAIGICDSTAFLNDAIIDIVRSAMSTSGQQNGSLKCIFVQKEIYHKFLELLVGRIETIKVGDTINLDIDMGPMIAKQSQHDYNSYIERYKDHMVAINYLYTHSIDEGYYCLPAIISVNHIREIDTSTTGPLIHVIQFNAGEIDSVIEQINGSSYGIVGIYSSSASKTEEIASKLSAKAVCINEPTTMGGAYMNGRDERYSTEYRLGSKNYIMRFMSEYTKTKKNFV